MVVLKRRFDHFLCRIGHEELDSTRQISRRVHFVRNGENCKMRNIELSERDMQLSDIATKNVGDTDLNPRMKYILLRIDN